MTDGRERDQRLHTVRLARPDDFEGWRCIARQHLAAGTPPESLVWEIGEATADLFSDESLPDPRLDSAVPAPVAAPTPTVSRRFIELARCVVCHRAPDRHALLYRVLWRSCHGEPGVLDWATDPDMHRLHGLGKCVARERHKMHAFVRFRQTPRAEPEHFSAWFEPEHHTLRLASDFFVRRFANMHWSIVTPEESAHWNGQQLQFGPGGRRQEGAAPEIMEELWRTYFANIFNPARLKTEAMRSEMPVKYWKNLPEAPLIAELIHHAGSRSLAMVESLPSEPPRYAAKATARTARDLADEGKP
ncbi:TIGR03915 family putative DNA repair protein [Granulosicoccus sp. 3-233]|uniref:TIGR03915 family putative DNA repair protein n=1 Tax=Granulosicoccus sp. 3-233 TaxID=3417969 RepID=UPI003D351378